MTLNQKFDGIYVDDSFNHIEIDSIIFNCDGGRTWPGRDSGAI